jgi:diguanylate cyclase (GGDEF)-like protein
MVSDRVRAAWEGNTRLVVAGVAGLLALSIALAVLLTVSRSRQAEEATAVKVAAGQLALSHRISEGALHLTGGQEDGVLEIAAALPLLDRAHNALRFGDPSLGISDEPSNAVVRLFDELQPSYMALRSGAERVVNDPADGDAAGDLISASARYRQIMDRVAIQYELEYETARSAWQRRELVAIAAAFALLIGLFVFLPAARRRRDAETAAVVRPLSPNQLDHLTGLPKRSVLRDRLDVAIVRIRRTGGLATVLSIDVDHLARVNDQFGHDTGDRLLQEVAVRLRSCVRASDTVARFNGDHFVVLLEGNHRAEDAAVVAEKLLTDLRQPVPVGGGSITLSASIGIAVAPIDAEKADQLLDRAHLAMQAAKRLGRATYQYFTPELKAASFGKLELLDGLRRALERGDELRLAYQPKINLRSGEVSGVEALLRWQHPQLGEVLPDQFIPVAEETELILPLGRWVIETACRQAAAWRLNGVGDVPVSVNVSARQFRNGDLVDVVSRELQRSGLPPALFEIELTEGVLMDDTERARRVLDDLRALGVGIAIDDFGTGYSSLSYLKRFPIDALKIDQSFIQELSEGSNDAAISTAIIALAHSLDLEVIAEGVEELGQLGVLKALDCDVVQGFLFAHPMPAASLGSFLGRLPAIADDRLWPSRRRA